MAARSLFTSESVSMGHPDKMCDQISDAVLDAMLAQDPRSRVACETLTTTGLVWWPARSRRSAKVEIPPLVRSVVRRHRLHRLGRWASTPRPAPCMIALGKQSPDISQGVTEGEGLHKEQGAGDQGMMFGFACDETPELMPAPIRCAHRLIETPPRALRVGRARLPAARREVAGHGRVRRRAGRARIDAVVLSTQHSPDVTYDELRKDVIEKIIRPALPAELLDANTIFHVNPTGRFVVGGPMGDAGLTGRKIIVDTYGGMGRHGGGAFSGKDPSKVDRSAAYAARYVAKNLVAAGLARALRGAARLRDRRRGAASRFASTRSAPARLDEEQLERARAQALRPDAARHHRRASTCCGRSTARPSYHGHFGREDEGFPWERTDRAEALRRDAER